MYKVQEGKKNCTGVKELDVKEGWRRMRRRRRRRKKDEEESE